MTQLVPTEVVTAQTLAKTIITCPLVLEHSAKTWKSTAITKCHTFVASPRRALHSISLKQCNMRLHFFKVHDNPYTRRDNRFSGFETQNFSLQDFTRRSLSTKYLSNFQCRYWLPRKRTAVTLQKSIISTNIIAASSENKMSSWNKACGLNLRCFTLCYQSTVSFQ